MATAYKMLVLAIFMHLAVISRGQKDPPPPDGETGPAGPAGPSGASGPVGPPCTSSFTGAGIVKSPNYPNNYNDYTDCTYILTAASGGFIKLTFTDFDLETGYDFLTIIASGTIIGRYTGSMRPPVLTLGASVTLRFTTDYSVVKKGFSVNFATIPANCGGLIVGSGFIQSPAYPGAYSDNLVCVWGVVATQGRTLTIDFQSFNIESNYDWLELYDGDSLVARYTATYIPPRLHLGSAGRLVFTTDSSIRSTGFRVAVASKALPCGGLIAAYATINSPNYPNNYPSNASCTWTYRALSNSVATRLTFTAFNLENNYDFVKIYDGELQRTSYTGAVLPKAIELRSRTITVIFTSDSSVTPSGFRLFFSPVVIP